MRHVVLAVLMAPAAAAVFAIGVIAVAREPAPVAAPPVAARCQTSVSFMPHAVGAPGVTVTCGPRESLTLAPVAGGSLVFCVCPDGTARIAPDGGAAAAARP